MRKLQQIEEDITEWFEKQDMGLTIIGINDLLLEHREVLKIESKIELLNDWIKRLSHVSQKDVIFPLAGQEFRNKVIDFIKEEISHLSTSATQKEHNSD